MTQNSLQQLIYLIAKLPGLGQRSAKRIALHLMQNKELIAKLSDVLLQTAADIVACEICNNLDTVSPCNICISDARDRNILCVVEGVADLWALENSKLYKGLYHVLGGTLSALQGRTPENLNIDGFKARFSSNHNIQEVIIATNATLEGESTGHYIANLIEKAGIKITRLAHGIPIGAEIDRIDEGTLTLALKLRQVF